MSEYYMEKKDDDDSGTYTAIRKEYASILHVQREH